MALFAAQAITSSGEPITLKHYAKFYIASLSYANLCFYNVWSEMSDRSNDFWREYLVPWQMIVAVTLDVLVLASFTWGIVYVVLRTGHSTWIRLLKWCMIPALLVPINVLRKDPAFASMPDLGIPADAVGLWSVIAVAGAVLGIVLLLIWQRISTRVTTILLILMAPSLPLALGRVVWQAIQGPLGARYPDKPLQPVLPQSPGAPHLIWVLFDEWDYALTFPERRAGILLPEVDRFQRQALSATRMFPPAPWTSVSVPSLLTGKTYIDAIPEAPSELMLTYEGGKPPVPLTGQDTIFKEARRRGFNVGIAGWYIPYCRLIPECTTCSWHPARAFPAADRYEESLSIMRLAKAIFVGQVRKVPLLHRMGLDLETPANKRRHALTYSRVHDDMLRAITDPRLNLIFVHMSVPHPPTIYDRSKDRFSTGRNISYLDNLRLVDRTVRDIRETLEKAGMWDASAILLTADHPLRAKNTWMPWPDEWAFIKDVKQHSKVPYLLKMPCQTLGSTYNKAIQEVVTKDLLLAILSKQVTTPQQVAAWLDANPPHQ